MATTHTAKEHTGNGSNKDFTYTIQSLKKEDIKVSVANSVGIFVDVTNFTIDPYSAASGTIKFNNTTSTPDSNVCESDGSPKNNRTVRIYRRTEVHSGVVGVHNARSTYTAGSSVKAGDLNVNQQQALYSAYEAHDQEAITKDIRDKAVTSAKLDTNIDIAGTFDVTGAAKFDSTVEVDGTTQLDGATTINAAATLNGATTVTDNLNVKADNKAFTVENAAGTDKFTVDTDNGNTAIAGTLDVTGATGIDGNFDINTNKFNVTASSGNTTIAGTLGVTGQTTLTGALDANGGATIDNIQIGVTGDNEIDTTSGNLTIDSAGGTVTVDDNLTVTGNLDASSSNIVAGDVEATSLSGTVMITASEEASGATANDTTVFSSAAADARFYQIGTSDDIQSTESWDSSDVKVATTKAVDARVVTLVDEVGGFVPITNETDFPATNPDINSAAGTIVSIGVLTTSYTSSGSGVITIPASTLDNLSNDLTITGAENSTTYGANFGMLVETKALSDAAYAAAPSYTFHRLVPKASEVTTLAGKATEIGRLGTTDAVADLNTLGTADVVTDMNTLATGANVTAMSNCSGSIANINTTASNLTNVNNFAEKYQIDDFSPSAPTTDGGGNAVAEGDLAYDTTANALKVYDGSSWQIGVTDTSNLVAKTGDTITGNLLVNNDKEIQFKEATANGSAYVGIKGATDKGSEGSYTISLPADAPTAGEVLQANASTPTNLEWAAISATPEGTVIKSTGESGGTKFLREDGDGTSSWQTVNTTPEGTAVLSTGESGGTKFLREDGDGTSSWQSVPTTDSTKIEEGNTSVECTDTGSDGAIKFTVDGTEQFRVGPLNTVNLDDTILTVGRGLGGAASSGYSLYPSSNGIGCNDTTAFKIFKVDAGSGEDIAKFTPDGAVELYYDNAKKLETSTTGVTVTGNIAVTGTVDGIDIATDVAANTAKVTNATHTGDVTGSTTLTIANDAVTGAKLNISLVEGDVIYASGTDTLARLAKGSAGEVLKMNSGADAPEWGTAGVTVANDANNRIVTGTGSGLNAEAKLTFDGTVLTIDGSQAGACVRSPIYENPKELAENHTLGANYNGMAAGPFSIASGKSLTISSGATFTIV